MKPITTIPSTPDDECHVRNAVIWNKRWGQHFNGLYHDEELAGPDGMSYQLFITKDTPEEQLAGAVRQIRGDRDAVNIVALVVPKEWLS